LKLEEANIESRPVWKPMHLQPVFAAAPSVTNGVSERLFAQGLCLPSGSGMSDADVARVCDVIARNVRAARGRSV
jgi:dTDP-4-amino-4,6-dideoxygalactose transaminase